MTTSLYHLTMSLVIKSAKMLLSYRGFQINSEKDLLKGILSILSDYLGSCEINQLDQQTTIFHHLAEGIPYIQRRRPRSPEFDAQHMPGSAETEERCQSSLSSVKVLEHHDHETDSMSDDISISFDLTTLSNYCSPSYHHHRVLPDSVVFLETSEQYHLNSDLQCKFIVQHHNHRHPNQSKEEDRVEIHLNNQEDDQPATVVASLPVNQVDTDSNDISFRIITFPKSSLNSVLFGEKYRFCYIDSSTGTILGKSDLFSFSGYNQQDDILLETISIDSQLSDEDGFVIVDHVEPFCFS